jgi:cytochrome-b5 reductase
VEREYTPVSTFDDLAAHGRLELLIKLYADGKMSRLLAALAVGAVVDVSEPKRTLVIPELDSGPSAEGTHFVLVAGGTGITPMYQLITALLPRLRDHPMRVRVSLLCSNHTHADVLLLHELDAVAKEHAEAIHVRHTLTTPNADVPAGFYRGRIDGTMLGSLLAACNLERAERKFIVCGPQPMMDHVCRTLSDLGGYSCTELEC